MPTPRTQTHTTHAQHTHDAPTHTNNIGHKTAKHVEILGNSQVIATLLKIATGDDEDVRRDRVVSDLGAVSEEIRERLLAALGEQPGKNLRRWFKK